MTPEVMFNTSETFMPHSRSIKPTFLETLRVLFYLISPAETKFENVADVPNYTAAASTAFFVLIAIEYIVASFFRKRTLRVNDGLTSIGAGILSRLIRLLTASSLEMVLYIYVYDNMKLFELPWDSSITWFFSFLGMDFAYYWFHRAAHEVNLLWASHQTHHSSEDYNLTTALRQSAFQGYGSMFFYMPCAFFIPPSVHLVHLQVNILFQFWIHTELVSSLGPLEYIFNTPSHHRVHHGRNPYCIDKNYAGALIIWDKMFGTFEAEKKNEEIAYGLVAPISTFNPLRVQVSYMVKTFQRAWNIKGFSNKLSVLVKGPGWSPGTSRLGDPSTLPEVENPICRYDGNTSNWISAYAIFHSIAVMPFYEQLMKLRLELSGIIVVLDVFLLIFTLTSLGFLFDRRSFSHHVECIRCFSFCLILNAASSQLSTSHQLPAAVLYAIEGFYMISFALWIYVINSAGRKQKEA